MSDQMRNPKPSQTHANVHARMSQSSSALLARLFRDDVYQSLSILPIPLSLAPLPFRMLVVSTHVRYPRFRFSLRVFPSQPHTEITHEPGVPIVLVLIDEIVCALPCEEVRDQSSHRIVLHVTKRLPYDPCVLGHVSAPICQLEHVRMK